MIQLNDKESKRILSEIILSLTLAGYEPYELPKFAGGIMYWGEIVAPFLRLPSTFIGMGLSPPKSPRRCHLKQSFDTSIFSTKASITLSGISPSVSKLVYCSKA